MDIANDDEVKFFAFTSKLLHFEDIHIKDAAFDIPSPVKVYSDEGDVIGSAVAYVKNHALFADVTLLYDCPERLDIENTEYIFLVPYGIIEFEKSSDVHSLSKFIPYQTARKLKSLSLDKIHVSYQSDNMDDQLIWDYFDQMIVHKPKKETIAAMCEARSDDLPAFDFNELNED